MFVDNRSIIAIPISNCSKYNSFQIFILTSRYSLNRKVKFFLQYSGIPDCKKLRPQLSSARVDWVTVGKTVEVDNGHSPTAVKQTAVVSRKDNRSSYVKRESSTQLVKYAHQLTRFLC